eukprot:102494-Hanusia_phi.AAC.1
MLTYDADARGEYAAKGDESGLHGKGGEERKAAQSRAEQRRGEERRGDERRGSVTDCPSSDYL